MNVEENARLANDYIDKQQKLLDKLFRSYEAGVPLGLRKMNNGSPYLIIIPENIIRIPYFLTEKQENSIRSNLIVGQEGTDSLFIISYGRPVVLFSSELKLLKKDNICFLKSGLQEKLAIKSFSIGKDAILKDLKQIPNMEACSKAIEDNKLKIELEGAEKFFPMLVGWSYNRILKNPIRLVK